MAVAWPALATEPFGMTLTGLKKHVQVLEEAGLVPTEKVGRARRCILGPRDLDDVQLWRATGHTVGTGLTSSTACRRVAPDADACSGWFELAEWLR